MRDVGEDGEVFEDRSFSHWNSIQDPPFSFTLLRRVTFGRRRKGGEKKKEKIIIILLSSLIMEANSAFECGRNIYMYIYIYRERELNNVSVNQSGNDEIDGGIERDGEPTKLISFSFGALMI